MDQQQNCNNNNNNITKANAEYVNNTTRQQTPLHQRAQYGRREIVSRECLLNYTLTYARKQG